MVDEIPTQTGLGGHLLAAALLRPVARDALVRQRRSVFLLSVPRTVHFWRKY
jgi:hypothetical protein